jgi:ABC-type amino acid transport substrate-binding protein
MIDRIPRAALLVLLAVAGLLAACSSTNEEESKPRMLTLRVGVAPDTPPLAFVQGGEIAGLEADFARELGRELGLRIEFVELKFSQLISALLDGRADILMSGLSVTEARKYRISFSEPYASNALLALMHTEDATQFSGLDDILTTRARIGVERGSSADSWVRENCPNAVRIGVSRPEGAIFELRRGRIDLYIGDGPAVAWVASKYESEFKPLLVPLNRESLAWGVRRNDVTLLRTVNAVLDRWKEDGTLDRLRSRWLPYYKEWESYLDAQNVLEQVESDEPE